MTLTKEIFAPFKFPFLFSYIILLYYTALNREHYRNIIYNHYGTYWVFISFKFFF